MALNLDKEYTERPEDQTKCVYCGNELGHKYKWAMAVTRSFKVCNDECKAALESYIQKDKKRKTAMFMLIFVACVIYIITQLFSIQNLLLLSCSQMLGGIAFFFLPYPFISFETFYKVNIKKTVKICKVIGGLLMISAVVFAVLCFV